MPYFTIREKLYTVHFTMWNTYFYREKMLLKYCILGNSLAAKWLDSALSLLGPDLVPDWGTKIL